jgi:nucleoside 2-deoxyribosyltransferase
VECVEGVDTCDVIIALVDGPDVDSGTAWELGYGYAKNKRIIALRTDYRGAEDGPVNIMIAHSSSSLVETRDPLTQDPAQAIAALLVAL